MKTLTINLLRKTRPGLQDIESGQAGSAAERQARGTALRCGCNAVRPGCRSAVPPACRDLNVVQVGVSPPIRSADALRAVVNRITTLHVPGNLRALRFLRTLLCLMAVVTSGFGLSAARGDVLVDHAYPSPPTNDDYNTWQSSFSATDGDPATGRQGNRVYDVFKLPPATFPLGADVTKFSWTMEVDDRANPANNLPVRTLEATSYRVNFWANEKVPGQRDQPGAELFSVELPAAGVHVLFKGLPNGVNNCCNTFAYYDVSVDLPQPFHAAPDTSYWVSWMAVTPTFQPVYQSYVTVSGGQLWQDRLNSDADIMARLDRLGNTMVYSLEGTATPPSFVAWIAGYGLTAGNAAADADPDLDGMPNGLEDVLGGNPTIPSTAGLPTASRAGGNFVFTFNRADVSETPDVTLTVQAGPDLVNWPTVYTIGPNTAASSSGVTITENGAAPDSITVTIPQGTAGIKFARLTVTVTP